MAEPKADSQLDKFKKAARELECDDDEQRFKERLGKLVKESRQRLSIRSHKGDD